MGSRLTNAVEIDVFGYVQGIGLRPTMARLAKAFCLCGEIRNTAAGVNAKFAGDASNIANFFVELGCVAKKLSFQYRVQNIEDCQGQFLDAGIKIGCDMPDNGEVSCHIPVDLAVCDKCQEEFNNRDCKRYQYEFISCASCGPRFSILQNLPYQRSSTSFSRFAPCRSCQREFSDCENRRFHAETISCSQCGPKLWYLQDGVRIENQSEIWQRAAQVLSNHQLLCVKGTGGYQWVVSAKSESAIKQLRILKHRPKKPFVLMAEIAWLENNFVITPEQKQFLLSPQSPALLVPDNEKSFPGVNPDLDKIAVMRPHSGLFLKLLQHVGAPLVVTSANPPGEPMVTSDEQAAAQLAPLSGAVLGHNLQIVSRVDDSICQTIAGKLQVLRPGRGYAPLTLKREKSQQEFVAQGSYLKNTVAVASGSALTLSPYVGSLDTPASKDAQTAVENQLMSLLRVSPAQKIVDCHPQMTCSENDLGSYHHLAHAAAVALEHGLNEDILAFSFDGYGYGPGGKYFGGEIFHLNQGRARHVGQLLPFYLPAPAAAAKRTNLAGLALLYGAFGRNFLDYVPNELEASFSRMHWQAYVDLFTQSVTPPSRCSSVGRLFDGIAALKGVSYANSYEGESAMRLEAIAARFRKDLPNNEQPGLLSFENRCEAGFLTMDWRPMVKEILTLESAQALYRFHLTLAQMIIEAAQMMPASSVVVGGGVFQNALLIECLQAGPKDFRSKLCYPQKIAANDSGLAAGQAHAVDRGWIL